MREAERILAEYARRAREIPGDFYSLAKPGNLFIYQQCVRAVLKLLGDAGLWPLRGREILDVGSGTGDWLVAFESWGANRASLHGIELDETRATVARARLCDCRDAAGRTVMPGADIRTGDASRLPWVDGSFDIVLQSTVFTSILDPGTKRMVAAEMVRVLKPGGIILWYDFCYDNPSNPNVRGIGRREILRLFPRCQVRTRRITLAPPLARRVVPWTWIGALLLEKLPFLRTHYLAVIRPLGNSPLPRRSCHGQGTQAVGV